MTTRQDDRLLEDLLSEAEQARLRGCYREGRDLAVQAVDLAMATRDDGRLAAALRSVANQSIRLGEYETAVRAATRAAAVGEQLGDAPGVVDSLNALASAHVQLGLFDEALTAIERSMALLDQVDDLELRCATYNRAGTVSCELGDLRRAGGLFERAERELRALGEDASNETQFCLLNNMADVVVQAVLFGGGAAEADVRQASARSALAMELAVASGNPFRQSLVALNAAVLLNRLGDDDEAQRLLRLSEGLASEGGYRGIELAVLEARALDAQERGRYDGAVALWLQTTELAEELSEWSVLSRAHKHVSRAYEELGDLAAALRSYRRFHHIEATRRTATAEIRARLVDMSVELEQLRSEAAELGRHAHQDALTGLGNRRAFDASLLRLLQAGHPDGWVCVCLLDVDHFKQINDTFGHAVGDDVLRELGRLLRGEGRRGDVVARIGGEELALVWGVAPPCSDDLEQSLAARVERVRVAVEAHPWHETADGLAVTVSLGAVAARAGERPLPSAVLADADALLYAAKRAGRNRAGVRVRG